MDTFLFPQGGMYDQFLPMLQQQGMSEKEAQIYLCTLELGSAPASTIARKVNIKRVTTYAILKDLERRQIASSIEKKGVSYFQVIDPTSLLTKMKEKYELFAKYVPELLALVHTYSNKPRIQYFEWFQGISDMYEDMLSSQTDILAFVGLDTMDKKLEEHLFETHVKRRAALGIKAKVIVSGTEKNKSYKSRDKNQLRETLVIEDTIFQMANEVDIYGPNKVAIALYSWDEMSGIIIHSPKLYQTLSSIFNLLWKQYKKPWKKSR
jgi:sugar-specific transcriptional regulator TrmB